MNHSNPTRKNRFIAITIGLVYCWFGALKFVPNLSPAEDLAKNTIRQLTFGLIPDEVSIILLAFWEVGLGFLLVFVPNYIDGKKETIEVMDVNYLNMEMN